MKKPGMIALLRFPDGEAGAGQRRPVLLVAPVPGFSAGWLVCAISTRLHRAVHGFDEVVSPGDADFEATGLKVECVIRIGRLAVAADRYLEGAIGEIGSARLRRIRARLRKWIGDAGGAEKHDA